MVRSHLLCKGIANIDVHFCFMAEDQVLRLMRREGKLSPLAWGPYTFVHCGAARTMAEVHNEATGKSEVVSAAHLRHATKTGMKRYPLP